MLWLQDILKQLPVMQIKSAKALYCNNTSAIALSKNPEHHARTKYIDIQYHFVRH